MCLNFMAMFLCLCHGSNVIIVRLWFWLSPKQYQSSGELQTTNMIAQRNLDGQQNMAFKFCCLVFATHVFFTIPYVEIHLLWHVCK